MRSLEDRGEPYKGTSVYEFTRQLVAHELIEETGRGEYKASSNLFD